MSDGMNKVLLIGNLGADPELKYTQSNQAVLRIRLATTESYADRSGQRQTRTEWHSVQVWGRRAEGLARILAKGHTIAVEGRISYRSWTGDDGQKRYATDVVANEVLLLTRRDRSAEERSGGDYDRPAPSGGGGGGGRRRFDDPEDPEVPF